MGKPKIYASSEDSLEAIRMCVFLPLHHALVDDFMLDRLIEIDNEYTVRYMTSIGHDAIASGRMTPELMHMLANAYYSGLFEIIRHEMPRDRAHIYERQLRRFFVMGWADLLQIERA